MISCNFSWTRRSLVARIACFAALGATQVANAADAYPNRPVRIVVGFPPGQGTDTIARAMAPKLQQQVGQTFFVENRPGAGGILGQQTTATAPPDGYTILLSSAGPMAVNPAVYDKLPYDPLKDYVALGGVISVPLVLVVNASLPVANLKDLIALARSKPGEINFASAGNGVTNHLAMEMLLYTAGVRMTHVPYKGSPPALTDLMAGRVSAMFDTPVAVLPFVKDGRLKAVAVGSTTRIEALPAVPTVAESGYPGFSAVSWMGFFAPAKTPERVVARLGDAIWQIVGTPEMKRYFLEQGVEPMPMKSPALGSFVKDEVEKWGKTAKAANVHVE